MAEQLSKEQKARKARVRIGQEDGDDGYCYVIRVDGRECYSGMDRHEAQWRRNRFIMDGEL